MERINIPQRQDWIKKIEEQGFLFYDLDNYYDETAAYKFDSSEVDEIEKASGEIFDMCVEAINWIIKKGLWDRMFIPKQYRDFVEQSWINDACSFYGRFDLCSNNGDIKLLEFNADTPTGLLEASVIQWYWLQDYNKSYDQFNSIHEKLVDHMKVCAEYFAGKPLHICCVKDHREDYMTTKYIEDCAVQAGIQTKHIFVDDISIDNEFIFCDKDGAGIDNIFKLYPWEWMFNEEFGPYIVKPANENINWIEPAYKALWSNKMLLVILHELFPKSKYILPASYGSPITTDYVKKPVFAREGANIEIHKGGNIIEQTSGDYGHEGFVYQQLVELPKFSGNRPIIGSWMIGGQSAGMGIREGSGLITNNTSRFVSHFFTK